MKDFIFNILIEISFLVLLAIIYYFYQKKRISKFKPDFSLEEELNDFQIFIDQRIKETDHDQDLIDFHSKLVDELKAPKKETILLILKNYHPKIKDTQVLEAIIQFQDILLEN